MSLKKVVGIEIGTKRVKFSYVVNGQVKIFFFEETPENTVQNGQVVFWESLGRFIRDMLREHRVNCKNIMFTLPLGPGVYVREIELPRMTAKQLLLNLPYEFSDYLAGENPRDYFYDYAVISTDEDVMHLYGAACRKDLIEKYRKMARDNHLNCCGLIPDVFAYSRAIIRYYRMRGIDTADKDFAVLDIGDRSFRIHFFKGENYQVTRTLEPGLHRVAELLSEVNGKKINLASLDTASNEEDALMLPEVLDFMENRAVEIMRIMNFYSYSNKDNTLDALYYCGGGTHMADFLYYLDQALTLPLKPFSMLMSYLDPELAIQVAAAPQSFGVTLSPDDPVKGVSEKLWEEMDKAEAYIGDHTAKMRDKVIARIEKAMLRQEETGEIQENAQETGDVTSAMDLAMSLESENMERSLEMPEIMPAQEYSIPEIPTISGFSFDAEMPSEETEEALRSEDTAVQDTAVSAAPEEEEPAADFTVMSDPEEEPAADTIMTAVSADETVSDDAMASENDLLSVDTEENEHSVSSMDEIDALIREMSGEFSLETDDREEAFTYEDRSRQTADAEEAAVGFASSAAPVSAAPVSAVPVSAVPVSAAGIGTGTVVVQPDWTAAFSALLSVVEKKQAEADHIEKAEPEAPGSTAEDAEIRAEAPEVSFEPVLELQEAVLSVRKAEEDRLRIKEEEFEKERVRREKEAAEKEAAEKARLEKEAAEKEAAEKARLEKEAAEKEAAEKIRLEKEAAEKAAAEKARLEKETAEKAAEKARFEKEAAEKAAEKARLEKEAAEKAAEKARLEKEAAEKAVEKARLEKEAAEKAAAEKARREKEAAEKAEADRLKAEKAKAARLAALKNAAEIALAEKARKLAAEKARLEKEAAEKAAAEKARLEKEAAEKAAAEKARLEKEAAEKAAAEKARLEKEAAEKEAAEKARLEKEAAEKAAAEKARLEKEAAEKAAAEKARLEKEATEKAAAEKARLEKEAAEKEAAKTAAGRKEMLQKSLLEARRDNTAEVLRTMRASAPEKLSPGTVVSAEPVMLTAGTSEEVPVHTECRPTVVLPQRRNAASEAAAAERAAAEKARLEKEASERAAAEKARFEREAAERAAAEKARLEKEASERAAAEKARLEKEAAERVAAEKARLEKEAVERAAAAEKARLEKEAAERAAAEKAAVPVCPYVMLTREDAVQAFIQFLNEQMDRPEARQMKKKLQAYSETDHSENRKRQRKQLPRVTRQMIEQNLPEGVAADYTTARGYRRTDTRQFQQEFSGLIEDALREQETLQTEVVGSNVRVKSLPVVDVMPKTADREDAETGRLRGRSGSVVYIRRNAAAEEKPQETEKREAVSREQKQPDTARTVTLFRAEDKKPEEMKRETRVLYRIEENTERPAMRSLFRAEELQIPAVPVIEAVQERAAVPVIETIRENAAVPGNNEIPVMPMIPGMAALQIEAEALKASTVKLPEVLPETDPAPSVQKMVQTAAEAEAQQNVSKVTEAEAQLSANAVSEAEVPQNVSRVTEVEAQQNVSKVTEAETQLNTADALLQKADEKPVQEMPVSRKDPENITAPVVRVKSEPIVQAVRVENRTPENRTFTARPAGNRPEAAAKETVKEENAGKLLRHKTREQMTRAKVYEPWEYEPSWLPEEEEEPYLEEDPDTAWTSNTPLFSKEPEKTGNRPFQVVR